ncbi:MAG: tetratricopeptide repeat protein [Opitutae bacterium]|nr:tetratricopeptide repeat protein [Opitutae bacterium]
MSTLPPQTSTAVFLSYAREDQEAARRIADALIAAGIVVWFDQSELRGGDAWDAKIKKQIRECALFLPVISAHTQTRGEGYFRREWNLAAQRMLDMAPGRPFLLPVVIDDTTERAALVSEEFLRVQWSRLPGGGFTPEFLRRVQELAAALQQEAAPPAAGGSQTPWRPPAPPRPRFSRPWLAAAGLLALGASWLAQQQGWLGGDSSAGTKQLAVLPFKNIGAAPHTKALSDGLSETLTSQLAQLQQFQDTLVVIPMSEVRKELIATASDARKVFGATLALTGSVQHAEDTVRVTVSLVDTATLRILRSATLDNPTSEFYRLQDRVAAEAARWLGLRLSPEARRVISAGQTQVAPAYELYLQGRGEFARRDLAGNLDAAIVHFQQALVKDPRYALAHAALGEAFWEKYAETKIRLWADEARVSCNSALEFGGSLASPRVTLAVILNGTGQYEQAVAEAQMALRLDPANADAARTLARSYARLNRAAEAEATYQRVIARNPDNSRAHSDLAVFYWLAGRNAEAERHFLRVAELIPDNYIVYRNLGGLYVMMGRREKAAEFLQRSLDLKASAPALSNLGTLRFQEGHYAEAATLFERAHSLAPRDHVLLGNLGDALRHLPGRSAEARPVYERAIQLAEDFLQVNPKDPAARASLARYCAFSGNLPRALAEIEQARSLAPANLPIMISAALVFERAGQRDQALASLLRALKEGYARADIEKNPDLQALRSDPQFPPAVPEVAAAQPK